MTSCVPMGLSLFYGDYLLARRYGIATEEFYPFIIAHGLALLLGFIINTFILTALAVGIMWLPDYNWIFGLLYLEGHRGAHVCVLSLIRSWRVRTAASHSLDTNSHGQLAAQLTLLAGKVGLKHLRIIITHDHAPAKAPGRDDEDLPSRDGATPPTATLTTPITVVGQRRSAQLLIPASVLHQLSTSQLIVRAAHALSTYSDKSWLCNNILLSYLTLIILATPLLHWLSTGKAILAAIGFAAATPYLTTWIMMLYSPLIRTILINPALHTICRRLSFAADKRAAQLTSATAMITMIQEQANAAAGQRFHPLYSWYHYARPSPFERITALSKL